MSFLQHFDAAMQEANQYQDEFHDAMHRDPQEIPRALGALRQMEGSVQAASVLAAETMAPPGCNVLHHVLAANAALAAQALATMTATLASYNHTNGDEVQQRFMTASHQYEAAVNAINAEAKQGTDVVQAAMRGRWSTVADTTSGSWWARTPSLGRAAFIVCCLTAALLVVGVIAHAVTGPGSSGDSHHTAQPAIAFTLTPSVANPTPTPAPVPTPTPVPGAGITLAGIRVGNPNPLPGQIVTLHLDVDNTSGGDQEAVLGASLTNSSGNLSDPSDDTTVTLAPGEHDYTRPFTIPHDAAGKTFGIVASVNAPGFAHLYAETMKSRGITVGLVDTPTPQPSFSTPTPFPDESTPTPLPQFDTPTPAADASSG